MSDDASLGRRRSFTIDDQGVFVLSEFFQTCPQALARCVVTNNSHHATVSAKSKEIRQDICCATQVNGFTTNVDNGNRSFWRNTRDVAPDKFVKHHIAQDDDLATLNGRKNFVSSLLR